MLESCEVSNLLYTALVLLCSGCRLPRDACQIMLLVNMSSGLDGS